MKIEGEPSRHKRFRVEREAHGSSVLASFDVFEEAIGDVSAAEAIGSMSSAMCGRSFGLSAVWRGSRIESLSVRIAVAAPSPIRSASLSRLEAARGTLRNADDHVAEAPAPAGELVDDVIPEDLK
ncbi:MAG: hypothetical protein JO051_00230 [Acidobacteriaceae bacterium]|nr:hypothetical protein [Acidobacteriaceae bacterium]